VATAVVSIAATVAAFGGLVGFWVVAGLLRFRQRGYRVRWLSSNRWLYEERAMGGVPRHLPFAREVLDKGYPAPCRVILTGEARWDDETPEWAHGRRAEIAARVAHCCGADRGGRVVFEEP
jgi:hypothetical protein